MDEAATTEAVTKPWRETDVMPAVVKSEGVMPCTAASAEEAETAEGVEIEKDSVVV